ncbi:MAG: beta-lactamase family protein [Kiritimatiellae bacterium]|nr:beta-lactamase family protein [Kiritimatiellia bacterium]
MKAMVQAILLCSVLCGGMAWGEGRVPPVICVERAGMELATPAQGRGAAVFVVKASTGSDYAGLALKRVRMTLDGNVELTTGFPSVTVDLLEGAKLSSDAAQVSAAVFPIPLQDREALFEVYLQDAAGKVRKLSVRRKIAAGEVNGTIAKIDLSLPEKAGGAWTETEHKLDVEDYKRKTLDLIKRAGVPSLQVTLTTPLDSMSFCVVNEDFYAAPGRQQESRPIDHLSMYQACSISKVPLGYFAVKMAQDGQLDLDCPLYKYRPDILNRFESERDREWAKLVTPRIVMTHTSGLPNNGYHAMKFLSKPGEKYIYSGVGIFLLQLTLEQIKGKTLDVFSKEELFDRIGMKHSNYLWQPEYEQIAVWGFRERGPQRNTAWGYQCNAAYSLRTSSEEYTKFLQWFLRGADLTPEWREIMFKEYAELPHLVDGKQDKSLFRNLVWVEEDSQEFGKIRFHGGNNVAYKGLAMMIPERHVTLCYFLNGDHRYNLHGPLTDLFLHPKQRLSAHIGGVPLPER